MLFVGISAALLTVASFVAQVVKIIRTRDTKSLSMPMWLMSTLSFGLWIVYGVISRQWPVTIPNAICFVLAAVIAVLKYRASALHADES